MFAYVTEDKTLALVLNAPTVCPRQFVYFIRTDAAPLTLDNIGKVVRARAGSDNVCGSWL